MTRYILDTNALLRYLLNDIPKQADEVTKLFTRVKQSMATVTIPLAVIIETVFALLRFYGEQKEEIGSQLFDLASSPILDIEKRDVVKKALLIWRKENVSFVDCLVLSESLTEGKTLFTFDQRLQKLTRRQKIL